MTPRCLICHDYITEMAPLIRRGGLTAHRRLRALSHAWSDHKFTHAKEAAA